MPKPTMPPPDFGSMLNKHIRRNRFYQAALARDIGVRSETVADFLKRPDNKVHTVWNICFALRRNFFYDLGALLPQDLPHATTPKDERIAELEKQVQELTIERDVLQKVLDILHAK